MPPLMYTEIAEWWPLLSPPEEYAEEAAFYVRTLVEACDAPPVDVLELGSGGGHNASHMTREFDMTLVDLSPDMLAVSRRLNPGCDHVEGDMRTVRLGREFDAVFVHDAIEYMTTPEDLAAAVETAFVHTKPGGAALFCPDQVRERFEPKTDHGGGDAADGRAFRFLQWSWDPDPTDRTYVTDYAYLLRERDGSVRVLHDRHECGFYSSEEWVETLEAAGFEVSTLPFEHSDVDDVLTVVLGKKPRH